MKSRGDTGDFYESAIGCSNKYVRYVGRFSNIKYRRSASIYIQNAVCGLHIFLTNIHFVPFKGISLFDGQYRQAMALSFAKTFTATNM